MDKPAISTRCQFLVNFFKEYYILFDIVEERETTSKTTMYFVVINGNTWVFEVNERRKWQYQFYQKWEPLSTKFDKFLLYDKIKNFK